MLIDINVDTGEGYNNEAKLIPLVSSCNIACGGHTGDLLSIKEVMEHAKRHKTRVGAHPSFIDKENFGRTFMDIEPVDLFKSLLAQVRRVADVAEIYGLELSYIKPHGALYHRVCNEEAYANVLIDLIHFEMPEVSLMGMPNCIAEELAIIRGVRFIREGFADRVYEEDGSLRNRNLEGSVLTRKEDILSQFIKICRREPIKSYSGKEILVQVNSICFHGDHEGAEENIEFVVNSMTAYDIQIGV
jgi:UPF0271 protein